MHTVAVGFTKNDDASYDLLVYIDEGEPLAEFAGELTQNWKTWLKGKKIRTVKFVVAGVLLFSIPFSQVIAKGPRYAMSYIYFGSYAQQMEYIALAQDTLSVISPSYFDLNADGSLKLNGITQSYVDAVHQKGIRVVPFLSNHWDRASGVAALNRVDELAAEIAEAVRQYNLDGVNVDIENVTHNQRDQYTALVRRLREILPNDKEVSVAVAANPNGWSTGWHGSYDYKELGKVADHLFLMTYDEHYQGGEAGPVASLGFVEDSVSYALRYVEPEKIVLGIPFFGRIWSENGSIAGLGISNNRVETIIRDYGAVVSYDTQARSPKAEFTLHEGDSLTVTGTKLPSGRYTIWFENSSSIKEKLALVDKYNLKGAGNWSSGQETREVWEYYDLWLNGKYFEDIYHHFAKDDIIKVVKKKYMVGTTNTTFSPDEGLTRAQAAVILSRVLGLEAGGGAPLFSDTSGHWAQEQISAAAQAGFLAGYPDGSFRPETVMTREEMASLLARMIQVDYTGAPAFSDVSPERWSYQEITALAGAGILSGFGDGTFRPEQTLTRGEMASLLERIDQ